jgi:hypothetical protein
MEAMLYRKSVARTSHQAVPADHFRLIAGVPCPIFQLSPAWGVSTASP